MSVPPPGWKDSSKPPAGWLADPDGCAGERWWDGGGWTDHRRGVKTQVAPASAPASRTSGVRQGLGVGAGLALFIFVIVPLLTIGGCAALYAASEADTSDEPGLKTEADLAGKPSAADIALAEIAATRGVKVKHPRPLVGRSCTYSGKQVENFSPDTFDYACTVTLRGKTGREQAFTQRVSCYSMPPGHSRDSCSGKDESH